jgi:hypothetical protein
MDSFPKSAAKHFCDKPMPQYLDLKTVLIYRPHPVASSAPLQFSAASSHLHCLLSTTQPPVIYILSVHHTASIHLLVFCPPHSLQSFTLSSVHHTASSPHHRLYSPNFLQPQTVIWKIWFFVCCLVYFWRSRVCWPLFCLCRPFCILSESRELVFLTVTGTKFLITKFLITKFLITKFQITKFLSNKVSLSNKVPK